MPNKFFSTTLLEWYSFHKRDLPWRKQDIDPYHVLVSEIMLQQTQVPRVIEKFKQFRATFPTLQDLAKAAKAEVIQAWSGLGYNRRALLLQAFAQTVVAEHQGLIPESVEKLRELPGIGSYTAGAMASFAFNLPEPAIDVNVRRMYTRFFQGKDQGLPMSRKEEELLYQLAKQTIPENKSREFHSALMDFGSAVCLRDKPLCAECPLQKQCLFFPLYDRQQERVLFTAEKKQEKGRTELGKFVPNRIFRGRIVEFTRQHEGKELSLIDFGKMIKKDYVIFEQQWLLLLCEKLKREGFVNFKKDEGKISLELPK